MPDRLIDRRNFLTGAVAGAGLIVGAEGATMGVKNLLKKHDIKKPGAERPDLSEKLGMSPEEIRIQLSLVKPGNEITIKRGTLEFFFCLEDGKPVIKYRLKNQPGAAHHEAKLI